MEFLAKALAAIPQAATSWTGAVLFVVVIVAWVVVNQRVKRNKQLLKKIKDLPEADRAKVLRAEMGGAYIKEGMSAEEFIRYQRQRYIFVGVLISVLAFVGILGFAMYLAFEASSAKVDAAKADAVKAEADKAKETLNKNRHYVSVAIPKPMPLREMAKLVERVQNVTIVFAPSCSADVLNALVDAGEHAGNDVHLFLEALKDRVRPTVRYRVNTSGDQDARHEIACY